MKQVKVIGAGFTGMLAAYLLWKRGFEVTVYDPSRQPGGLIATLPHPEGDIETAANGFLSHEFLRSIADEIGVRLVPASKLAAQNRYLWNLFASPPAPTRWPLSWRESFSTFLRFFFHLVIRRHAPRSQETLEQWGSRVLGEAATQKLLSTVTLGIYASHPRELSASLVIGRFFKRDNKKKSGKFSGTVAPEKGMGQWFSSLKHHLETHGVRFVQQEHPPLEPEDTPTWICTSAPASAKLLTKVAPELSSRLSEIRLLPVVSVTRFQHLHKAPLYRGFGCLFHPEAGFSSLGVLWSSDIFPNRFHPKTRASTWILGGSIRPDLVKLSDSQILDLIERDEERLNPDIGGGDKGEQSYQITRWPAAFPHYSVELEKTLTHLPRPPVHIHLCGNYLGRLGLSQIALQVRDAVKEFQP